MKTGPSLIAKLEFFDRRRKTEALGTFILRIRNSDGQFARAPLSIYYRQDDEDGFKIEAKSAVLWDIIIHEEEWRRKGIGTEWLGIMRGFAKSEGAERFYAHYVKPEGEAFFARAGFIPTHDPMWWIMKNF
jgi:GNAT superfamily N-acetyltransferase